MPSLDDLKAKWFLPLAGEVLGVPQRRREGGPGPELQVSTDGNTVEMLIDGQAYMQRWHADLIALAGSPGAEAYHSGWRLESVYPLGHGIGPTALEDLEAAALGGADVYVLLSEHIGSYKTNLPSVEWLREQGVSTACRDDRYPVLGSNHQKAVVFKSAAGDVAVLGSIDLSKSRWDRTEHLPTDPGPGPVRDPASGPTHDVGIAVRGPAVADLDVCFRERWNDSTRTSGMSPGGPPQPVITTPLAGGPATGTHSVQVLRTYGMTRQFFGYSWSPSGEFTTWASYLNAIRRAETYIYLEDQYFLAWGYPPRFARPAGPGRDVDIVYQLGEAMKRGVKVAILTPSNAEDPVHGRQSFQRDLGVNYLSAVKANGATGDVVVASLKSGTGDVYVHSKLMLVDDEFALIGSTNIGERSMTHDTEIHVGVVDSAEAFCREFRKALWAEHTGLAPAALDDPDDAFGRFQDAARDSTGHLKPYPVNPLSVYPPGPGTEVPILHGCVLSLFIDPYAGPDALE